MRRAAARARSPRLGEGFLSALFPRTPPRVAPLDPLRTRAIYAWVAGGVKGFLPSRIRHHAGGVPPCGRAAHYALTALFDAGITWTMKLHKWRDIRAARFTPEQIEKMERGAAAELLEMDLRELRELV